MVDQNIVHEEKNFLLGGDFDSLVNILQTLAASGSPEIIENLDKDIEEIKTQVDEINAEREKKSVFCKAITKVLESLEKKKDTFPDKVLHSLLVFLLNEYLSSLKNEIFDTKPDVLLRQKGLILRNKEALSRRSSLAMTVLSELGGG